MGCASLTYVRCEGYACDCASWQAALPSNTCDTCAPMRGPSAITLTRTDTTLDHSQEAEKVCGGNSEQQVPTLSRPRLRPHLTRPGRVHWGVRSCPSGGGTGVNVQTQLLINMACGPLFSAPQGFLRSKMCGMCWCPRCFLQHKGSSKLELVLFVRITVKPRIFY